MSWLREFRDLFLLQARMNRQAVWIVSLINIAFAVGLVYGFGFVIPDVSQTTALYLVTGTATQMIVTVALVVLPQQLSQLKGDGRLEYFLTLPINREAYLLSHIAYTFAMAAPAIALALALGAWHYGFSLHLEPALLAVVPLAVLALAGVGIVIAVFSPHMQITNGITQLIIFYVLFFAPVILPKEQLPAALETIGDFLPATYVADAMRATTTDLPGTDLWRSMLVMAGFGVVSVAASAVAIRRRG
jgi:ABC-2 type transport system permease protein